MRLLVNDESHSTSCSISQTIIQRTWHQNNWCLDFFDIKLVNVILERGR